LNFSIFYKTDERKKITYYRFRISAAEGRYEVWRKKNAIGGRARQLKKRWFYIGHK
jgi:hypothetical protein